MLLWVKEGSPSANSCCAATCSGIEILNEFEIQIYKRSKHTDSALPAR